MRQMKTPIFVLACGAMFFCSCGEIDSLRNGEMELEELTQQYEEAKANEKEMGKEGDDISPKVETQEDEYVIEASAREYVTELMNQISIAKEKVMRSTYSTAGGVVGVFKVGSCGNYKEFTIVMDCEDSRDASSISGSVGDTFVDKSGNINFRFCLTESNRYYPGGVLSLNETTEGTENSFQILVRRHDTEDSNASNSIWSTDQRFDTYDEVSKGYTKISSGNIILAWGTPGMVPYYPKPQYGPSGIEYGMLLNLASIGQIYCDDEDSKNANWAQTHARGVIHDVDRIESTFGVTVGSNTIYKVGLSTDSKTFSDMNRFAFIYRHS